MIIQISLACTHINACTHITHICTHIITTAEVAIKSNKTMTDISNDNMETALAITWVYMGIFLNGHICI